jgi:hypothetical protein
MINNIVYTSSIIGTNSTDRAIADVTTIYTQSWFDLMFKTVMPTTPLIWLFKLPLLGLSSLYMCKPISLTNLFSIYEQLSQGSWQNRAVYPCCLYCGKIYCTVYKEILYTYTVLGKTLELYFVPLHLTRKTDRLKFQ